MLTTSLHHYFVKGLAFATTNPPKINVVYVVNEEDKWRKDAQQSLTFNDSSNQNKLEGAKVIYDEAGKIYTAIGLKPFKQNSISTIIPTSNSNSLLVESSILFLVDQNNKILMRDNDYRAQGEHLKPLERLVKRASKIEELNVDFTKNVTLKVGDKAPDFILKGPNYATNSTEKLLDDQSNFKVLTFYPAAFSGQILPNFNTFTSHTGFVASVLLVLVFGSLTSARTSNLAYTVSPLVVYGTSIIVPFLNQVAPLIVSAMFFLSADSKLAISDPKAPVIVIVPVVASLNEVAYSAGTVNLI